MRKRSDKQGPAPADSHAIEPSTPGPDARFLAGGRTTSSTAPSSTIRKNEPNLSNILDRFFRALRAEPGSRDAADRILNRFEEQDRPSCCPLCGK